MRTKIEKMHLCVGINLNIANIKSRHFGDVIVLAFALLFLQLERDATNGAALNTPHQMRGETGNLIAKTFGGNNGNLIGDLLVGVKVERETGIVFFDQDARGLLDGLCTDTALQISEEQR